MRATLWVAAVAAPLALTGLCSLRTTAEPAAPDQPVKKPYGLEKREPWTTSKVQGSPEPPAPYQLVRTYPNLKFFEALELAPVPGRHAWVVAERRGTIFA